MNSLPAHPTRSGLFYSGASAVVVFCLFLMSGLDRQIAVYIRESSWGGRIIFKQLAALGDSAVYLLPSCIFFLALRLFSRRVKNNSLGVKIKLWSDRCLFLFLAVASSGLLVDLLKIIFGRSRPIMLFTEDMYRFAFFQFTASMWSFPSGHANTAFCVAMSAQLMLPRYSLPFWLAAIAVAASRVIGGSHYPSDVIMGALLAAATTLYLQRIFLHHGMKISCSQDV